MGDTEPVRTSGDPISSLEPRLPSPLQPVEDERFARRGVRLLLKRDDLIHPRIPGNKWRKLVPNLRAAVHSGQRTLLTFGGAYSNHLRATAAAGRLLGLETVGVVRGQELASRPLNPSLAACAADGMRLHFVDRGTYRRKREPAVLADLHGRFGDFLAIPEGGSNAEAVRGCVDLGRELRGQVEVAAVACGTGGTLAGLAAGLSGAGAEPDGEAARALGFPVLRGTFLTEEVTRLQREAFGDVRGRWTLDFGFPCGGFARTTPRLDAFAEDFSARHQLPPLERVYVAKLLYGLTTLVERGAFPAGSRVAAVITG